MEPEPTSPATTEPREARPCCLRAHLVATYGRELPRVLREVRWLMLGIAALMIVGAVAGYHSAARATFAEYLDRDPYSATSPFGHLLGHGVWGNGWLGFFGPNTLKAILHWCGGFLTLGAYGAWCAWYNGWVVGWLTCGAVPTAREMSGVGPFGTAAAVLLPHGLFEYPAFVLAWALAVRTGLAWVWRVPGYGRWASMKRMARDFRTALLLIIPMMLLAALLETYVEPRLANRYLKGLNAAPQHIREQVAFSFFRLPEGYVRDLAISPDERMAIKTVENLAESQEVTLYGKALTQPRVLLGDLNAFIYGPSWSPDAKSIALVAVPSVGRSRLLTIDVATAKLRAVPTPPGFQEGSPAWSPRGGSIAICGAQEVASHPRRLLTGLWVTDTKHWRWRRLASFATGNGVALSMPTWSPDGRCVAFRRSDRRGSISTIWTIQTDGTGLRQVTHGGQERRPLWSPDGRWIAFLSRPPSDPNRDILKERVLSVGPDYSDVCLVHPDGTGRMDGVVKAESLLAWSADSRSLYYARAGLLIRGTPRALTPPSPAR